MEVILRTDIEQLGQLGQTVKVKPGYGRNYLLPQGLAMLATAGNKKRFEQERKKLQSRLDSVRFAAQGLAERLGSVLLRVPVRVGENDKLYGSVTSAQIVDLLAIEHNIELDKKKLHMDEPLRALGEYSLEARLSQDVKAQVRVWVVRHDAQPGDNGFPAGPEGPSAANLGTTPQQRPESTSEELQP